jgi:cyclase
MGRLLIVGKVVPGTEERIAEIFAESDQTELPMITGARHRSLYCLGDLYLHLIETEGDVNPARLQAANSHPLFVKVNEQLAPHVSPYLSTWRSPRDALARCFYHWDASIPAPRIGA